MLHLQHATSQDSWIHDLLPEPQKKFRAFAARVYQEGALDLRTKELIAVACSSVGRCRHCTRSHIEAALEAGASRQEIAETLAVLWAIGSGVQVVWNKDGFEEHLRAHAHA